MAHWQQRPSHPARFHPGNYALPRFDVIVRRFDASTVIHSRTPSRRTPDRSHRGLFRKRPDGGEEELPLPAPIKPDVNLTIHPACHYDRALRSRAPRLPRTLEPRCALDRGSASLGFWFRGPCDGPAGYAGALVSACRRESPAGTRLAGGDASSVIRRCSSAAFMRPPRQRRRSQKEAPQRRRSRRSRQRRRCRRSRRGRRCRQRRCCLRCRPCRRSRQGRSCPAS